MKGDLMKVEKVFVTVEHVVTRKLRVPVRLENFDDPLEAGDEAARVMLDFLSGRDDAGYEQSRQEKAQVPAFATSPAPPETEAVLILTKRPDGFVQWYTDEETP
jgi:hypothetical protein